MDDVCFVAIQVDNQLFGAVRPVMVYVTPNVRRDIPDSSPALHITAYKVPSAKWNAEIFKVRCAGCYLLQCHKIFTECGPTCWYCANGMEKW